LYASAAAERKRVRKRAKSGHPDPEGVKPQYENDYTMNYDPEGVKPQYEKK
jgi:hypothetical protein